MEWKRARRDETLISHRRTWVSRCMEYKVQESVPKYALSTMYYALYLDREIQNWMIIGRHRTRKAAAQRCNLHQQGIK